MRGVWRVIAGQENDSTGFSFALRAGERNLASEPATACSSSLIR
jgi:hypothetical protein